MYVCSECWEEQLKWAGQCGSCKSWNTLKQFHEAKITGKDTSSWEVKQLKSLENLKESKIERIITTSPELNNVLGWWIVPGSVVLLSGDPWIGKSTITLQLGNFIKEKIIYISWEETEYQISDRSNRLNIKSDNFSILSESNIENILQTLVKNTCDVLVIDSISVMHSDNITGTSGSISQVRYITELLVAYAKKTNTAVFVIGHITKDGSLAGPKTLEHMVDTVLYFEGEKFDDIRILRGLKNRFGSTNEVWIFKMWETGLSDVTNPGLEFINPWAETIGSSLSITIEWTRPIVVETESLTTYTKFGYPKRSTRWVNSAKLDLIIAVISKYTNISLDSHDVYSNIARWLKIEEPGIDLSLAASIISSKSWHKIPKDSVFIWEISLTGKIKKVIHIEKRIKEAEKMGFKKIILPKYDLKKSSPKNIEMIQIASISELIKYV